MNEFHINDLVKCTCGCGEKNLLVISIYKGAVSVTRLEDNTMFGNIVFTKVIKTGTLTKLERLIYGIE